MSRAFILYPCSFSYKSISSASASASAWGEDTNPTTFTVTLPQHSRPCSVHFIANCPDAAGVATENDLTALYTATSQDAYWQCVEVPNLLASNDALKNALVQEYFTNIPLIRNYAKVTVDLNIKTDTYTFTDMRYMLINVPDRGSVVPFNTNNGQFVNYYEEVVKELERKPIVIKTLNTRVDTARDLVLNHKEIFTFSSIYEDYLRENTPNKFWLVNTNKLLKHCEGMDGLKTGYTSKAGYNLTSTVKRNGIRILTVVMNEKSIQERSQDTIRLVNYAFSKLKVERIYDSGEVIGKYVFPLSMGEEVELVLDENVDLVGEKECDFSFLKTKVEFLYDKKAILIGNLEDVLQNLQSVD